MTRLDADWLREGTLTRLLQVLDREGEEARVVGGAVRNSLLGVPLGDIDIATTALPPEAIRRVEGVGFKAVPTGIDHGTVTVVAGSRVFEVTTLREDVVTDGRHAKVAFGRDWRRDAERRQSRPKATLAWRPSVTTSSRSVVTSNTRLPATTYRCRGRCRSAPP